MTNNQSISDRIREMAARGMSRAEIARAVDRSYQQVRQVLVADEAKARRVEATPSTSPTRIEDVPIDDLPSKSARIRRLAAHGFRQADIARRIGVSDQFVSNIVRAARPHAARTAAGVSESGRAFSDHGAHLPQRLEVDAQGRIRLPDAWGVRPGTIFIARNFKGDLVFMDAGSAARLARTPASAVDDLIAERRLEAMREFDD